MTPRYLVYLRQGESRALKPESLAHIAGIARADADQVLKAKVPRALSLCATLDKAKDLIRRLERAGLRGLAVRTDHLDRFFPKPVYAAVAEDNGISWNTTWGGRNPLLVPRGEIRMIVVGKIHSKTEVRTRSEIDPVAGYVGVGATMNRYVSQDSTRTSNDEESFCCLLDKNGNAICVWEGRFDYRSTLRNPPPTREKAFLAVIEMARKAYTDALYDDTLYRYPAAVRTFQQGLRGIGAVVVNAQIETYRGSTAARMMSLSYLKFLLSLDHPSSTVLE